MVIEARPGIGLPSDLLQGHAASGLMRLAASTELTISGGAITLTQNYHSIDTEGNAASDDLDTINGGTEGFLLVLRAEDAARTVVVKDGTGNILLPSGDYFLDDAQRVIALIYDGLNWRLLGSPPGQGIPSGMIAIFDTSCPGGWTRVSAFDSKFLKGAAAYGGTGGGASHSHAAANHTHTVLSHVHDQKLTTPATGKQLSTRIMATGNDGVPMVLDGGSGGGTLYPVRTGAQSGGGGTSSTGGNIALANNLPSYIDVVFCKKD